MRKSTDQILAEKLAHKELEIANLLATNERIMAASCDAAIAAMAAEKTSNTCIIVGNGPSLNQTDLGALAAAAAPRAQGAYQGIAARTGAQAATHVTNQGR